MEYHLHILSENSLQSRILYFIKFESMTKMVLGKERRSQKFTSHTFSWKVHLHLKKVYQGRDNVT